jgi:hypothetical protein
LFFWYRQDFSSHCFWRSSSGQSARISHRLSLQVAQVAFVFNDC